MKRTRPAAGPQKGKLIDVLRLLSTAGLFLLLLTFDVSASPKEAASKGKGCLGCHQGIETINTKMAVAWGADRKCEVCHYGDPAAASKLEAHAGLIANPGDLRVIERTCGKCHSDYGEIENIRVNGQDNHVGRVLRSVMATAAGEIAGTRYLWNEQKTRDAAYGVRDVIDLDRIQMAGAVDNLKELPPAENSNADHLLRSSCLRCHLWTEDKSSPGTFRSSGCSACHVVYGSDGLSHSGDPTIPKDQPGHPLSHSITTDVQTSQCLQCHNDGGARIGLSYTGLRVTDSTLERKSVGPGDETAFGAYTVHVTADIHFRRGMDCIDCHDTVDVHGDGNIYSHQEFQVGIRCESCHGTAAKPPTFKTERGAFLTNVFYDDGKPYLMTKNFSRRLELSDISSSSTFGRLADIWHKGHQKLECYSCHSVSAPQCYACHLTRDDSMNSKVDWGRGIGENEPPREIPGSWTGRKLVEEWLDPVLGINRRGQVTPLIPGGQSLVTHLDESGTLLSLKEMFTTAAGLYGFSQNPVQPHSITSETRTCQSCHSSSKALGLGSSTNIELKRHGLAVTFPPDQVEDKEGVRIQDSPHEGVRPFSAEELRRIYRTGSCIGCHSEPVEREGQPESHASIKEADEQHQKLIELLVSPKEK